MFYFMVMIFSFLLALSKYYFHKLTNENRNLTSGLRSDTNILST